MENFAAMATTITRTYLVLLLLLTGFGQAFAQEENYESTTIKSSPALNDSMPGPVKQDAPEKERNEPVSPKKFDPNKLRIGINNFGFQFGTLYDGFYDYNFFLLQLTPTAGYLFLKDHLELGTGPILIYEHYKRNFDDEKFNYFTGGATVYTRGYIWKGLFAQAQYDFVNKPSYYDLSYRVNVNHLLLGAGYSTPIGRAGNFFISALFDVINNPESIYRGTFGDFPMILSIGFGVGFPGPNGG